MTIMSGVHAAAAEKLAGNGHAKGMTHVLTARPYVEVKGTQFGNEGWGGGISIDQFLGAKMATPGRLNSVEAGVVSFYSGGPSRYMSYSGAGQANIVPVESDPRKLFARLVHGDDVGNGRGVGRGWHVGHDVRDGPIGGPAQERARHGAEGFQSFETQAGRRRQATRRKASGSRAAGRADASRSPARAAAAAAAAAA